MGQNGISAATRHSRPMAGERGAVSAAHPLAVSAGVRALERGGTAVDAAIAAQAMICVIMPQAAGLGGDMLALVRDEGGVTAVSGTGRSASISPRAFATDGGAAVTVPGLVHGWTTAHRRWGVLPLADVLAAAIAVAKDGYHVDGDLALAVRTQRDRIAAHGASAWPLLDTRVGALWRQPELAALLQRISEEGASAFYTGRSADAISSAVSRHGGTLARGDLEGHVTDVQPSVETGWNGGRLHVQPPPTQGTLLAMAARWFDEATELDPGALDHVMIEATEAAFAYRDTIAGPGDLLSVDLDVDRQRARLRGGPRAYLHTAGVAVADSDGMVVSSLVSVFDDFGSGVYVPELGLVLNNRAAGFTAGDNAPRPGAKPVHTLAPALLIEGNGDILALATPGADGQVQTLLQVLARMRYSDLPLEDALTSARWRSEGGSLLTERDHPAHADLVERGHPIVVREPGDGVFGAVVAAGLRSGIPFAAADWRRAVSTGAL